MTQQLHSKALMATVKELMAKHHQNNRENPTIVMESLHAEDDDSDGKRSHKSSAGIEQCLLSPKSKDEGEARARDLSLDLTLDSYPSTDSLHVLGELLCDIRRSCTTSLTSTPISSDGEVTGGADAVFESKLRRSEMELRAMGKAHSTE